MMSFIPNCCRYSIFRCNNDFPFTKASALGCKSVQGLNLVPSPAENIIACILSLSHFLFLIPYFLFVSGKGLHQSRSSCTQCFSSIFTLNLFLKCLSRASAAYTLRCCPPVQPKLIIRLWNPLLM